MNEKSDLTLTWRERTVLQAAQAALFVLAVVLNLLYLFVIKANGERLKATEILQACKTFLVLVTLLITMPLQMLVVNGIQQTHLSICLLKDFMEKLLFDAYPFVIMAVAITRFRVSICKGNSAILVTTSSAIATFALCLLPTFLSGSLTLFLYFYNNVYQHDQSESHSEGQSVNECRANYNSMVRTYHDVVFITLEGLPVLFTIFTYCLIYYKVSNQRSKTSTIQTGRRRHQSTAFILREYNIKATVILIITVFPVTWLMYMFLTVLNIYCPVKLVSYCLILWKPLVFVIHPLAEGLLLQQKRQRLINIVSKYNFCKEKKHLDDSSGAEDLIDSSVLRPSPSCPSLLSVQRENIETISLTPDSQTRFSIPLLDEEVEFKEEVFEDEIAPLACLHTRRTGNPISMLSFTEVNPDNEETDLRRRASESTFIRVPSHYSHRRRSLTISPYRIRCASVTSSSITGDPIGVVLSTKALQTPKSCLKPSSRRRSTNISDKRSSCSSCYLRKDVSPISSFSFKDVDVSPKASKKNSAKHSVRFVGSPSPKDSSEYRCSRMNDLPNLLSAHF
ncbi:uncharacterized protein [Argopecten irradians]|uniref:uncharacterized protein n=1 Tax=Argopecten irradians TaxID=31199 RepID=UPI0037104FF2